MVQRGSAAGAAPDTGHWSTAEPAPHSQIKLISEQVRPGHRNDSSCSALRAKSHLYPLILDCNPLWDWLNCSAFKSWGSGGARSAQKGQVTEGGSCKWQEKLSKNAL